MGGRLSTPPSSASSSSATTHRNPISSSTMNLAHPRTHSTGNNPVFPPHRHRSSSGHHHHHSHHRHHHHHHHHQPGHALVGNHQTRQRTGSTNIEPIAPTALNLDLLRYVGLNHESDDQSSDEDSPRTHRRIPQFFIALRDVPCPVCNKTIPHDTFDKHLLQCLSKPRIAYNEDTLTEDKGECVICLDDLLTGQKIARLPCLCIYHKSCIDNWFQINRTCPEHPELKLVIN